MFMRWQLHSNTEESDMSSSPEIATDQVIEKRVRSSLRSTMPVGSSSPSSPPASSPRRMFTTNSSRRQKKHDADKLKKGRRLIDQYLKKTRGLSLLDRGIAYFSHRQFVIVVEVPADSPGMLYIYTMVSRLDHHDTQTELTLLRLAMELNYMLIGTHGATLGLDGKELNLCLSLPIPGLSSADFGRIVDEFTQTAEELHSRFDLAGQPPRVRGRSK